MSTYSLRRFSHPDALKQIAPEHLRRLFAPHAPYFQAKGVDLAVPSNGLDYEGLARVFMNPDADMPHDLVDALYFIHEMATPEAMDILLAEARERKVPITDSPDLTPADVSLQVWLEDRDLLERKHAEQQTLRHRSFEYFQTDVRPLPRFRKPDEATLSALQESLNDWFVEKRRGRGARVFAYEKEDGVWFLVRHGETFKREGSINDGQSSSVFYRPEKHDVLVYDPKLGELRLHVCSKGETDTYRAEFGRHLFGSEHFFPGTGKYTLDPLRTDGAASLVCSDVEGMEHVVLQEVHFFWGGAGQEVETRKADDLFAAYAARQRGFPESPRILKAKFSVKFSDSKKPRTLTIRPSNIALYTRDSDAAILEAWLSKRGFIVAAKDEEHHVEPVLVGAGASAGTDGGNG